MAGPDNRSTLLDRQSTLVDAWVAARAHRDALETMSLRALWAHLLGRIEVDRQAAEAEVARLRQELDALLDDLARADRQRAREVAASRATDDPELLVMAELLGEMVVVTEVASRTDRILAMLQADLDDYTPSTTGHNAHYGERQVLAATTLAPHAEEAMARLARVAAPLVQEAEAELEAGIDLSLFSSADDPSTPLLPGTDAAVAERARLSSVRIQARVIDARGSVARVRRLAEERQAACLEVLDSPADGRV